MVNPGFIYEHYKKKKYLVLGVAKHSETLEDLVVYTCLYDNEEGAMWVRPLSIWEETVEIDGEEVPRFTEIGPSINQA